MMSDPARHVGDAERRHRLGVRHGLVPTDQPADLLPAVERLTALHATEAPTVHLSAMVRVPGLSVDDVLAALYAERSLVKQMGMRRTLFGVTRRLLPAVVGGPGARVAAAQRRRLVKELVGYGVTDDGEAWLADAEAAVLAALDDEPIPSAELRRRVPQADVKVHAAPGSRWGQVMAVGPRLLTILSADGLVARADNAGPWWVSRPTWLSMERWLGEPLEPLEPAVAYAEVVRSWLWTFGPGTEEDLVWWLGSTKTTVRQALASVGAVPVSLDHDGLGWLLPDDLEPVGSPEPWAALLPTLDPTTMGWRGRGFYLDPADMPYLFDSVGNAGPTAWVDGRVVGAWAQDDDGRVRLVLRGQVAAFARGLLEAEAARLTRLLDGRRVPNVFGKAALSGEPIR